MHEGQDCMHHCKIACIIASYNHPLLRATYPLILDSGDNILLPPVEAVEQSDSQFLQIDINLWHEQVINEIKSLKFAKFQVRKLSQGGPPRALILSQLDILFTDKPQIIGKNLQFGILFLRRPFHFEPFSPLFAELGDFLPCLESFFLVF